MPVMKPYDMSAATDLDRSYVAGFIDGEGCFFIGSMINVSKSTGNRYPNYNAQLKISNNDRSVLEWIVNTFGGRITTYNKNRIKDRNHFTYDVYMTGNLLTDFTESIIPFLKVKKPQAEVMLKFRKTFGRTGSNGPRKPSDEIMKLRSELRHEMTRLNSRFKDHVYVDHFKNLPPCCPSA